MEQRPASIINAFNLAVEDGIFHAKMCSDPFGEFRKAAKRGLMKSIRAEALRLTLKFTKGSDDRVSNQYDSAQAANNCEPN